MADYTIAVSWSGKDALADSDANKVISGDDFHTEFTTVQTAINSKADVASETFTGTPLAPTAAEGTNSTQIATTAFVRTEILGRVYPVGSIFTTVTAYADSAAVVAVVGGTTWAAFGAGKVLVGLDSGDASFDTVEETGGSKTDAHTLTESEMPSHYHDSIHGGSSGTSRPDSFTGISASLGGSNFGGGTDDDDWGSSRTKTAGSGGAHTHDIVQPYIVVYFWKRTA